MRFDFHSPSFADDIPYGENDGYRFCVNSDLYIDYFSSGVKIFVIEKHERKGEIRS